MQFIDRFPLWLLVALISVFRATDMAALLPDALGWASVALQDAGRANR